MTIITGDPNVLIARLDEVLDDLNITLARAQGVEEAKETIKSHTFGYQFLLIEKSIHDGSAYVTIHATASDACRYMEGQEFPEDWEPELLINLASGSEYHVERTVKFDFWLGDVKYDFEKEPE